MRAEAEGGPCVFVGDACCVMTREQTRGSDACDAEALVCCHERREREMLGQQYVLLPGDALCCFVFFFGFERILILGE